MAPRKQVFKEPIIRVRLAGVRFPKKCPVCGVPAETTSRMTTIPNRKAWLRPSWDPGFTPAMRRRMGIKMPESSTILIPVCEEHVVSDESDCRYRTLCTIANGLIIAVSLYLVMTVGSDLWLGRSINMWGFVGLLLMPFSIIAGIFVFKDRPLEASVKIIGYDHGAQYIWLAFKSQQYREEFYKENEMTAEYVTWIIRS